MEVLIICILQQIGNQVVVIKGARDLESGEKFAENFERVYVEGGFRVELYVAEDGLGDFVADGAGKGNEHGFGKGGLDEFFHQVMVLAGEGEKVLRRRVEAQDEGELKEEAQMEIAEVAMYRIKGQDALLAPLVKSFLIAAILDRPVEDFRHEHCYGILEYTASDAVKRMLQAEVTGIVKV